MDIYTCMYSQASSRPPAHHPWACMYTYQATHTCMHPPTHVQMPAPSPRVHEDSGMGHLTLHSVHMYRPCATGWRTCRMHPQCFGMPSTSARVCGGRCVVMHSPPCNASMHDHMHACCMPSTFYGNFFQDLLTAVVHLSICALTF